MKIAGNGTFSSGYFTTFKIEQMKFFKKIVTALGVSVAVFVNSNCKADGG